MTTKVTKLTLTMKMMRFEVLQEFNSRIGFYFDAFFIDVFVLTHSILTTLIHSISIPT